ncbi:hypothetical protein M3148_16610 [Georgenia satyanarayanai]|uniref:hypothetical protein n=1 Tax=Georgenia satyanarayanai TaxID=860221 RepID=UPI00203BE474|nr:hypothetical protein [Georgenia satyanarayanai]MCM3662597.1 hypothetical protein [Georgenia satyanarayanai]
MNAQEHAGWSRLATRVLDRLPSTGDSAVHTAIAELQEIAPAIPSGAVGAATGVRSPEWYAAEEVLRTACDGLGVPLMLDLFARG